ncbi:hypothetical protein [Blautia obeum]|nr:hypothetical protein [Blautia obeum]
MTGESNGGGDRHRQTTGSSPKKWQQKTPGFRDGKLTRQEQPRLYLITWNDNADAMLNLPGGGAMLFLTDVDHVSFEKANETRQNNLQSATVSLQVVMMDSYKGTLESIKKGVLYSKDSGDGDTYSMIPPTEDVVSSYSVDVTKDNGKTVHIGDYSTVEKLDKAISDAVKNGQLTQEEADAVHQ